MGLERLRGKIDKIDEKILDLFSQRAKEVIKISEIKKKKKLNTFSPEREAGMLMRLREMNKGPFSSDQVEDVFREILSACRRQSAILRIAYLGPKGTFTHEAASKRFGKSSEYIDCSSIADVFAEVEHGRANYGVVPIENSTEGAVNHTLDMFVDSDLKICSEVYLSIRHNLIGKVANISSVRRIVSHPQVFGQCRKWIETNLPHVEQISVSSTSQAAYRLIHPEDPSLIIKPVKGEVAIASKLASELYGLNVLAPSIEDSLHNITRFLVIGTQDVESTKKDKTSIVFSMKDKSGALHDILVPFKKSNISLTKIESRPSKKRAWKYYFFVDFEGHKNAASTKRVLDKLKKECIILKVLGSYPEGK